MEDYQPKISVIMNCYNSSTYLKEAIDSVYAQTFKNWEIIFYDNNSSDDSSKIAQRYDRKLRYIKSEKTLALGAARNKAIAFARGEYLAILDCDDLWLPEKLEAQLDAFDKHQSNRAPGLCYTESMRIDKLGNDLLHFAGKDQSHEGDVYRKLILSCFIDCASAMIKRSVLEEVGYFNESYDYVEEWDLWIRIARQYDVVCVKNTLTKTRMHSQSSSSKNVNEQFLEKISLIDTLYKSDKSAKKECKRVKKHSILQYQYSLILLSRSKSDLFFSVIQAMLLFLRMPLMTFFVLKTNCNPALIKAFKKKYLAIHDHLCV